MDSQQRQQQGYSQGNRAVQGQTNSSQGRERAFPKGQVPKNQLPKGQQPIFGAGQGNVKIRKVDVEFVQGKAQHNVFPGRKFSSFRIVIRRVERPFSAKPIDDLDWICQSLGFFDNPERDRTAMQVMREIMKSTESGEALSSTAISNRVGMSRGAVINQLNNLMRSGFVIRNGRFYSARSRSVYRTIEEIEDDIERIFSKMKRAAMGIDQELGISGQRKDFE